MSDQKTGYRFQWLGMGMVALLIVLSLAACRTQDIRTKIIKIPDVKTEAAKVVVSNALAQLEGVFAPSIHFEADTVVVTYDSMKLALKNMEFAIADAGFAANDTPANAAQRAALPAAVRD